MSMQEASKILDRFNPVEMNMIEAFQYVAAIAAIAQAKAAQRQADALERIADMLEDVWNSESSTLEVSVPNGKPVR